MAAVRLASGSSAIVHVGVGLARRRGRAEDLHGDLHGRVELALTLVLEHHADQGRRLVAGAAAGAAQDGLGQLVLAKLAHLAGEADLGVGIEPQAEEPLGRRRARSRSPVKTDSRSAAPRAASSWCCRAAGPRRPSPMRRPVPLLLQKLGQVQPELGLGLGVLGHLGEFGDRLVLVVVPPIDRASASRG